MNCLKCGFKNNATVAYCQRCGTKLDMTADEIRDALVEKAADERGRNTEYYAKQALYFAIILFVVALTLLVLSGGANEESYAVPSIVSGRGTTGARYTDVTFSLKERLRLEKSLVPYADNRR